MSFLFYHTRDYLFSRTCTCSIHCRDLSCFLDLSILHTLTWIGKVITRSLSRILLVYVTCIHMWTLRKIHGYMNSRVHTRNTRTRQTKSLFRARSNDSEMVVFLTVKVISVGGFRAVCMSVHETSTRCCTNTFPS
jgi:hypothetical protein